jgi:hypothetical protein
VLLEEARTRPSPSDWVYVNNFQDGDTIAPEMAAAMRSVPVLIVEPAG